MHVPLGLEDDGSATIIVVCDHPECNCKVEVTQRSSWHSRTITQMQSIGWECDDGTLPDRQDLCPIHAAHKEDPCNRLHKAERLEVDIEA